MKIVQAVGWYLPESVGGSEVYVAALARHLAEAGHEVAVAAPDPRHLVEREYEHGGIRVYRYPIPARPTRAEAQGRVTVRGAERFHAWLRREQADVVHCHTFVTGLGLPELGAARSSGARVIVTDHCSSVGFACQRGTMMRWGETVCDGLAEPAKCAACALQARGVPRPAARALGAIPPGVGGRAARVPGPVGTALGMTDLIAWNLERQRRMLAMVDRFVLLTAWAREAALANGAPPDKLALVRLGVAEPAPAPKPPPEVAPTAPPVTVGYLGRLHPIKGVEDLVRAVGSLPAERPIRIEIRGPAEGPDGAACLARLIALAGGDPRIHFGPPVARDDVAELLPRWDLLCCPSLALEGGPTVALEARCAGTPVVGSRIGGLAELVRDDVDGRLVPPGDWRRLAAVLDAVARDPRGTVDRWRRGLPRARSMREVTADCLALYTGRAPGGPAVLHAAGP